MSNFCCTFAAILAYRFDLVMSKASSVEIAGAFFCFFLLFSCSKMTKNAKKCKKMQKNEKKSQKNLHISKICCNFAPSFERDTKTTPNYKHQKITKL